MKEQGGRAGILAAVDRALPGQLAERRRIAAERLAAAAPERPWKAAPMSAAALLDLFAARAAGARAPVERLATAAQLPAAIRQALQRWELDDAVVAAAEPQLQSWLAAASDVRLRFGTPSPADRVGLVVAIGAVAETGTVLLSSGPHGATSLAYLPEYLIVVLPRSVLVAGYDEVLPAVRARSGAAGLPRTLNFVTGPSRTRDIEELLLIGAHGPRALLILAIDSA